MSCNDPGAEPGDQEVTRPLSGEVVAALVENHRDFLAFLERRLGDRAAAEDILQDAFLRSIERAGAVRDQEAVTAWFYRTLRNAVVDHHRRAGARARAVTAAAAALATAEVPDEEVAQAVCRCVARLADTLKPEYALALRKVEVEGLSVQRLADELGITANNAAVRLFRARQALKKQVVASCGSCAAHGCLSCSCEGGRRRDGSS